MRRAEVRSLLEQARALRRVDYTQVLALAESAFELSCQTDAHGRADTEGMASALSILAHRNCVLGDSGAALSQAAQALALVDPAVPTVVLAELYDTTGWAHFSMGDYAEAFDLELRALSIAESVGDLSLQAYVMDSLANVQSSTGHSADAFETQTRALALHRELGDLIGEATTLNNMTYTKMDLGDMEGALECAHAAADYAEKAERTVLLVGTLDTLCDVHMALGELDAAEGFARRGLNLAADNGWRADETNCLIGLARISVARNHLDDAKAFAQLALALAEQDQRNVEQYRCHELISLALEKQTDFAGALEHYKKFRELEQARVNADTQSRIANLRVEHQLESARKDAEIHRLRTLALEQEVEEGRIAQEELEAQASLDPLTGLFNRGHLPIIAEEMQSGLAHGRSASLLILDVDDFKTINDTFGHRAGDRILVAVARDMVANVRDDDVTCRYGGDEFLVYLAGTGPTDALATAERIREAICNCKHEQDGSCILVSASIGVASVTPEAPMTLDALIERADAALYLAKDAGRNRVVPEAE
jgi:diguanylate cyclase (GGDEF)-like protein